MKKFWLGLTALMVSMTLFAERVSLDDAALVANHFMNAASANNAKKAAPAKKMVRKASASEDLFYLYENENGEGWVIVSANDAMRPILAYSETGHFRTDNMPSNIKNWLGKYNTFTRRIEADGVEASEEAQNQWKALRKGARTSTAAVVVGPLIQTTWDQDAPYWNLCPGSGNNKAYTGCVATAMAQVMKYWEWPVQGTGSRTYQPMDPNSETGATSKRYGQQTANFGATTYDWAHMKNSYSGSYTETEATAVATLMYHCGVATDMMYGNSSDGGSGTMTVNYGDWDWSDAEGECAQNALYMFFGYQQPTGYMRDGYTYYGTTYYEAWSDADWTAMIKAELDLQRPIMYGGGNAQSGGGHSFICDGYRSDDYFHFNWGWSGSNDGYFLLSNLVPGSGGAGGGGYNFTPDQDVIIGIVPDRADLPPVTVTWSVDGDTTSTEVVPGYMAVPAVTPEDCSCGKVFVGWTEQSNVSGTAPADLFTEGKVINDTTIFYAVFAEIESEGGAPTEVASVTFKSRGDSDSNQDNSSNIANKLVQNASGIASYSGSKLYEGKNGLKMGSGSATGSITLTLTSNVAVSKVTVNASQYGSDTGKLKVTVGSTELGSQTPATNLQFLANPAVETNTITVETTSKRAYVASISVTAGAGASYNNYTISCGCSGTALNHTKVAVKVAKVLENGQIVILRDNKKYSIIGQRIQ